ncbi:MAG: tol-pal system YbgF family protein [Chitinophagales bacterium]
MATYNKGRKVRDTQPKGDILEQEIQLQESYGKAERFIEDNRSTVLGIVAGIAVLVLAFLAFNNLYIPGQEKDAQAEMYVAEGYFKKDSFQLALNGDGNFPGFLEIIDNYSGMTDASNLAAYYAGVSYLNLGDYDNAITYLKKFSGGDEVVGTMALGAMGDAYSELGDMSNAISYYKKAAGNSDNDFTATMYWLRAGQAMEQEGDNSGAKSAYEMIKKDYPNSEAGRSIEKYIARVEAKM